MLSLFLSILFFSFFLFWCCCCFPLFYFSSQLLFTYKKANGYICNIILLCMCYIFVIRIILIVQH